MSPAVLSQTPFAEVRYGVAASAELGYLVLGHIQWSEAYVN